MLMSLTGMHNAHFLDENNRSCRICTCATTKMGNCFQQKMTLLTRSFHVLAFWFLWSTGFVTKHRWAERNRKLSQIFSAIFGRKVQTETMSTKKGSVQLSRSAWCFWAVTISMYMLSLTSRCLDLMPGGLYWGWSDQASRYALCFCIASLSRNWVEKSKHWNTEWCRCWTDSSWHPVDLF